MVVYTPSPDTYGEVAEAVAESRDDRVSDHLPLDSDEEVVYVAPPEAIDEDDILGLQQRQERDPENRFSVITGRTPESAIALHERETRDFDEHAMVFRQIDRDWYSYDDETTVLCGGDATTASVEQLLDSGLSTFSVYAPGWPEHIYLEDGYLCGFPTEPEQVPFEGPQPFCVSDGAQDCPLEGDIIHADDVVADHVLMASCGSSIPNHPAGRPVHVGMGLLENAVSVVGTNRMGRFVPQASALHYALLRSGYDTSDRVYVLNRNASRITEPYRYIPFGRPSASVGSPVRGTAEVSVAEESAGYRITASSVSTHLLDVTVDGFDGDGEVYVRNETDDLAGAPLYYTAFEENGRTRILVYSWGKIEADRIELAVRDEPIRATERQVVRDSVEGARTLSQLGLLDKKAKGQLSDLEHRIGQLSDTLQEERYELNAHRDSAEKLDRLVSLVDNIRDRVISGIDPDGAQTPDYLDRVEATGDGVADDRCHCCGRAVYRQRLTGFASGVEREKGVCPHCGKLYDVPYHGEDTTYPKGFGEWFGADMETERFEISFTNPKDTPMRATFVPYFMSENEAYRGLELVTPERRTETLAPGESTTVSFDVDLSEVPPNKHGLFGYVVGNLDLYLGLHPLVNSDERGHVRTDFLEADHPIAERYD